MSIILAEAEKSRMINVFQAFANEYLWDTFDMSAEIWWVHMSMYYGGVVLCVELYRSVCRFTTRPTIQKLIPRTAHAKVHN